MTKPGILTWVDENWESIECQFYEGVRAGALNAAFGSVFTGKFPLALGLAGVSYAASKTAEMAGCNYVPPEPDNPPLIGGCQKIKNGVGTLYANRLDMESPGQSVWPYVTEIIEVVEGTDFGEPAWICRYMEFDPPNAEAPKQDEVKWKKSALRYPPYTLIPGDGAECEIPAPDPEPPVHNPGDPISDPITHTDGDCNWTIQATDAYVDDQGIWHTYYTITADNDACGGPFAYWSSGDGPQIVNPYPPDPPNPPNPPVPPPDWTHRFDDIDDTLDDIQEQLDDIQDCACGPDDIKLAKHWRSIRFESDEQTPRGNRRLSKLFRYRGISPGVVDAVADHWKDFRWTTGPVCVQHKGSPLGTPQVWAASVAEGQRVIRHAGGEAGIDPDKTGEWRVSGSDNSRYGVSLEVGLFCVDGCWSATSRPGPDGYPEAAVVFPDP